MIKPPKVFNNVTLWRICSAVLIIFIWEFIAGGIYGNFILIDPVFVSRPTLIARDFYEYALDGLLFIDLSATLLEAMSGFASGLLTGICLGLLLSHFRTLARIVEPYLTALTTLPRIALAPIMVIWFGLGLPSKVVLSFLSAFLITFFNTYVGVLSVDQELINAVKVLGASSRQIYFHVILPSVYSWVFASLRVCVGYCLIAAVAGEFVGATMGIGYRMLLASGLLQTDRVFSCFFLLMIIGYLLVESFKRIENRLLKWRPQVIT